MHYTNTSTVSTTETSYNQLQSGQVFAHYTIQEKAGEWWHERCVSSS